MQLLSLGLPREAIGPGFGAIILLSVVISGLADQVAPAQPGPQVSYFLMVMLLSVIFLAFAFGIWKVGEMFGGKGKFEEALIIGIFFQAILLPFQVLQIILSLTMPGIAGIYGLALLIYGVWINVSFIDALHGFASFGRAFGVLLLASFVAAVALVMFVSFFGQSGGLI